MFLMHSLKQKDFFQFAQKPGAALGKKIASNGNVIGP